MCWSGSVAARTSEAGQRRRRALRRWFASSQRDFSWRRTRDPWQTFVAETLLRRTQAKQVEHRIGEVLTKYPTPQAMADASKEAVRADLRSFGLRWRADNLAASARVITREHDGHVPTDTDALLALPGVGPYVASATVAAVEGTSVMLIDTNTVRVATRVDGIHRKGDIRRQPDVIDAVERLLGGPAPARDWWAVLDLGALLCTPLEPRCNECAIQADCLTGQQLSPAKDAQACS